MDQVFKSLPVDLQWEILTDFVGGFAVRNNKLRRLLSQDSKTQILKHTFEINPNQAPSGYLKNFIVHNQRRIFMPHWFENAHLHRAAAFLEFSHKGKGALLFKTISTEQYSYCYYNSNHQSVEVSITPMNDSVTLPPYEKHDYPSFPFTNRKLGRPEQTMKSFDPSDYKFKTQWDFQSLFPSTLELGVVVVAVMGVVFGSHLSELVVFLCVFGSMGICAYLERMYTIVSYNKRMTGPWLLGC